jgi:hypothetical protein
MELFTVGDTVFLADETEKKPRPKYRIININTKPLGHVEPTPEEFHNKRLDGVNVQEPNIYLEPCEVNQELPRENPFNFNEVELAPE